MVAVTYRKFTQVSKREHDNYSNFVLKPVVKEMLTTLLYYHYTPIAIEYIDEIISRHRLLCESLHLHGRVRISEEGYNGTLDGTPDEINQYIASMEDDEKKIKDGNEKKNDRDDEKNRNDKKVKNDPSLSTGLVGIHWKLGVTTVDRRISSLSVKRSKEIVSLDLDPASNRLVSEMEAGKHLTPQEFHDQIEKACHEINGHHNGNVKVNDEYNADSYEYNANENDLDNDGHGVSNDKVEMNHHLKHVDENSRITTDSILLDVRNSYETNIGRFEVDGILTVDPCTRNYSEFTRYVDSHINELKNKNIYTYCTGGVRCEKASKYLRYKGIERVYQLSGGIHAYMTTYPSGGYFKGKNFVYDPRIAISYQSIDPAIDVIVGRCCRCQASYDDYTKQFRCNLCRILILVCDNEQCCNDYHNQGILCDACTTSKKSSSMR